MRIKARIPGRILVMDDEKSVQLLLDRVFTGGGHSIVEICDTALER